MTNKNLEYIYKTMLSYCLTCRKSAESKDPKAVKIKNGTKMILSKYAVCYCKELKFIKEQEGKGILSKLTGIKVPILNDLPIANILFQKYKMNEIVNNLLLAGYKFMPEMHLKQSGFTYNACGPFSKNKERI